MSSLSDNSPLGPRKRAKIAGPDGSTGSYSCPRKLTVEEYTVGWICPLEVELIAALEMLDEEHAPLEQQPSDHNVYTLGSIAGKNLVIAGLWQQRNNAAATVVTQMRMTFPNIRFGLLVGIGGGVPIYTDNGRLRLGDVVVSKPSGIHSGAVQYDRGKAYQGVFQRTGTLSPPPAVLLHAAQSLSAKRSRSRQDPVIENIRTVDLTIPGMRRFRYPGAMQDRLYPPEYMHKMPGASCLEAGCQRDLQISDESDNLESTDGIPARLVVHRGTIASGECVVKDGRLRDQLAAEHDILCFEMEAAGALADFPCLVIRGISDYCDTHKNDEWQGYAALAAAAYARELFFHLPVDQLKLDVNSTLVERMERLEKHNAARERDKILNFISSFDHGDVQADTLNRSHEGTGQWLLNDPKFKDWIKEKQTLFCPGLPGAGKTVMTSIVNDFLHSNFQNQPDVGIGYVFCDFRQRSRQNLHILIGCLLRQLIRTTHQIPAAVQKLHARGSRPPTKDLLECFESVIGSFSRVYLVIDALDECEETTRNSLLSQLLKTQSLYKLHILATSRHVPEITSYFEGHPWLEIRAHNDDVLSFLSGQMPTLPRFIRQDSRLREFVIQSITQATDGMFLLARLYIDSIKTKPSIKAVKLAIRDLPTGSEAYQHAYKAAMERICSQDPDPQRLAKLALSWLTCARETLTLTELQYALAVEPGSCEFDENLPDIEALMSSYAGLVAFDEKSHIIRHVHYKTQHYLEKTWKLWFPNAHADIAETCLTYLSYNVFGELPENDDSDIDLWTKIYPLHNYSARNWSYHYREQSAPKDLVLWFLEKERNVSHALRELAYTEEGYDAGLEYVPKKNTGLHLTAYLGLESLTEELLHTIHPDVANDHLETPLALASRRGYEGTVRILLARGATVDSRDKDEQTPLFQVAHGNHETTVKTLLDWGADPGAEDKRGNKPFFQTTAFKHERICGLLLQRSQQALQLTPKNSLKSTLQLAARNGSLGIVKLILDSGGDPNCIAAEWSHKLLDAPVSLAAKNGHTTVVELLLSRISGSDLVQQLGQTALRLSAACGKRETVRLLISKVASLNETHLWSITALMNAIIEDHADIVELLLHHGACPNVTVPPGELIQYIKGSYGSTMLPKGQFRLRTHIEKLRNRSMDINTLSLAAEGGNKPIITCLIRHNAAPPVQGQGSLSWACQYGYYCLVETLLEEGAEPNWANSNLEAPIIEAAKNGNYEILDVLLRHGASAEASDLSGRTALSMAAELGYEEIVRRLLDFGVSGRQMDLTGQTPLSYAMDNGHESIFKLLAHHDHLTLLIPDIFGRTPLLFWAEFALEIPSAPHTLREFGLESPSNILAHEMERVDKAISSMEDAACVQHVGKCLLWAINNGHREVATQLLRQGAGPNYQNSAGNTPLVLAAQKNDEFMVRCLLDFGAEPNSKDDMGRTALSWALLHSNREIIQLLLDKMSMCTRKLQPHGDTTGSKPDSANAGAEANLLFYWPFFEVVKS